MLIRLTPNVPVASMYNMSQTNPSKCDVCGTRIQGCTGHCRTHKFAIRRAARRVRAESLVVEQAGGAWWVWDAKGNTLVIGQDSKVKALAALDLGDEE